MEAEPPPLNFGAARPNMGVSSGAEGGAVGASGVPQRKEDGEEEVGMKRKKGCKEHSKGKNEKKHKKCRREGPKEKVGALGVWIVELQVGRYVGSRIKYG